MIYNKRPQPVQSVFRFDTATIKSLLPDVVARLPSG